MLNPDEVQRYNALKMLGAAFPNNKIGADTVLVYMATLSDLPLDDLKRAILWTITHNTFFPTVAEIRAAALKSDTTNRLPTAEEAWGAVVAEMHRIGTWGPPHFHHPAITRAVQSMGWREICLSTEPGVVRGQFLKMYTILATRQQEDRMAIPTNAAWNAITSLAAKMLTKE